MKRKRFQLKMHVGTHDWLRYGETYEGEVVPEAPGRLKARVRLFKPGDDRETCEVKSTFVKEVD